MPLTFQFMLPTFSRRSRPATGVDILHNARQDWRARTYLRSGVTGLNTMDAASAKFRKTMKPDLRKMLRRMNRTTGRIWAGKRLAAVVSWAAMNRKVNVALRDLMKREKTARLNVLGR